MTFRTLLAAATTGSQRAPAGTPKEIVERLNRELRAIPESTGTRKFFSDPGAQAGGGTPQELDAFMRAETAKRARFRWSIASSSAVPQRAPRLRIHRDLLGEPG